MESWHLNIGGLLTATSWRTSGAPSKRAKLAAARMRAEIGTVALSGQPSILTALVAAVPAGHE